MVTKVPDLSQLGKKPPALDAAASEHRILFLFPDDHSIDGIKADILGITPEQISVAILHLQRYALMTLGMRDAAAKAAEMEALAVQQQLAAERKGN